MINIFEMPTNASNSLVPEKFRTNKVNVAMSTAGKDKEPATWANLHKFLNKFTEDMDQEAAPVVSGTSQSSGPPPLVDSPEPERIQVVHDSDSDSE